MKNHITKFNCYISGGLWEYHKYIMNFEYIGEKIPENVSFTEYYDYILDNFRNPKPKEE